MESKIQCSPATLDVQDMLGYTAGDQNFPGLESLCFSNTTSIGGFNITGQHDLKAVDFWQLESVAPWHFVIGSTGAHNLALISINAPLLHTVQGKLSVMGNEVLRVLSLPSLTQAQGVGSTGCTISSNYLLEYISLPEMAAALFTLTIQGNPKLIGMNLDKLATVASTFLCAYNELLYGLSLPALTTVSNNLDITNNYYLEHVSLPVFLPTNGKRVSFANCALEEEDVDHVLARCVASETFVSGNVVLNGGTNAVPGEQGLIDKAVLIARGVNVSTN